MHFNCELNDDRTYTMGTPLVLKRRDSVLELGVDENLQSPRALKNEEPDARRPGLTNSHFDERKASFVAIPRVSDKESLLMSKSKTKLGHGRLPSVPNMQSWARASDPLKSHAACLESIQTSWHNRAAIGRHRGMRPTPPLAELAHGVITA